MSVLHCNGRASIVRLSFELDDLPSYLKMGLDADPATLDVECVGRRLIADQFSEELSADFVKAVCKWGNYPGIAGKIIKHNSLSKIAGALRSATKYTTNNDLKSAIESIIQLHGLAVSFGSKHLKFLDPTRHVVLDSIISERLGYLRTPEGYVEFATDCARIRDALHDASILREDNQPFRIADVEMAIFQLLRSKRS